MNEDSLNQETVTISDCFELALAEDVTLSESRAAGYNFSIKTYYTKGTTTDYTLGSGDKIINYVTGTIKEFQSEGIKEYAPVSGFYVNTKNKTLAIGKDVADSKTSNF